MASITLPRADDEPAAIAPLWHVKESRAKAFVDFQNDVTVNDIALADREGFSAVEHLKRYTTLGMATDQGKIANVSGLAILAELSGRSIPQVGTTTYRPPYVPVSFGAMAGHHRGRDFRPIRLTPSHQWAAEQGAVFVETGAWLRAQYYPRAGEKDWLETVNREVTATRGSVGVCDVSTFGKIEIEGADAAVFLDRVCANTFSTLAVSKARYALLLREDGFVMDDGTVARLAPERFVMMSTTANAVRTMQHLEFCAQVLWPSLDVQLVSVSEQWAQFAIAGPRSREVLRKLIDEKYDVGDKALPHLGAREVTVGGIGGAALSALVLGRACLRAGGPGALWRCADPRHHGGGRGVRDHALRHRGARRDAHRKGPCVRQRDQRAADRARPRARAHGVEQEGLHRPRDGAAPGACSRRIGPRSPASGRSIARRGCAPARTFCPSGAAASIENDQGYMTSVAFSPMLGHWIGLGVIARGPQRIGERVRAYDPVRNGDVEVEICNPVFFDAGRSAAPWLASRNAPRSPASRCPAITAAPAQRAS